MDYIEPAVTAAAALLATKTFDVAAQDAADRLWGRLKGLSSTLRHRSGGDPGALLDRIATGAAEGDDVDQLAALLQALVDDVPDLRVDVEELVPDDATTTFNVPVSGSAHVGKIVNIRQARDVTF